MNDKRRAIYTHGYHESVLRSHRRRTAENSAGYLLPYLVPGLSVLDVGCGPGTITVDLAARVVPGSVTGVEPTDDALSLARAEAQLHRLSNISFTTSDVHKLDFPDDAFDVVHAHQVLQHVADPVRALQEMRRVCTPGGIVAARMPTIRGSSGSRSFRRWTGGWTFMNGRLEPTAANRMPAGGCCPGPVRQDSTTSRRRPVSGVSRRPRPANGGA